MAPWTCLRRATAIGLTLILALAGLAIAAPPASAQSFSLNRAYPVKSDTH